MVRKVSATDSAPACSGSGAAAAISFIVVCVAIGWLVAVSLRPSTRTPRAVILLRKPPQPRDVGEREQKQKQAADDETSPGAPRDDANVDTDFVLVRREMFEDHPPRDEEKCFPGSYIHGVTGSPPETFAHTLETQAEAWDAEGAYPPNAYLACPFPSPHVVTQRYVNPQTSDP